MIAKTERFEMRIDSDLLNAVDAWRAAEDDYPSRADAMRQLIETGLRARSKNRPPEISDGEKLILLMLADMQKEKSRREMDPDFISQVIYGGHYWALDWEMTGVFHGHADKPVSVSFVVDVLDMYSFIEDAMNSFTAEQKAYVEKEAEPFGTHVAFRGFDGNNEGEMIGITRFLVEKMDRFQYLKDGRSFNSHMPTIDGYRRMVQVFEPIRANLIGRRMTPQEVVAVLLERVHPDNRK